MTDEARSTTPSSRGGVVYLTHRSAGHEELADEGMAWIGHWERVDPPGMLGEGVWTSAAEAIAWARERCDAVIIRVDLPGRQYSAGNRQWWDDKLPEWPPEDVDRFDP
jgi:hypothetical protein